MAAVPSEVSKYMGNAVKLADIWGSVIYNVKAYGAKGDGIHDDTQAILAAINAARLNGGGIVYFPPGVYLILTKITIDFPFLYLRGSGRRITIFRTTSNNMLFEFVIGTGDSLIEDITFETTTGLNRLMYLNNSLGIAFRRCFFSSAYAGSQIYSTGPYTEFIDCAFNAGGALTVGLELDCQAGKNIGTHIAGCTLSGPGMGLKISYSNAAYPRVEGVRIIDTAFETSGRWNLYIQNSFFTQVTGCGFDNGYENAVIIEGAEDPVFDNCYFGRAGGATAANFSNVLAIPGATSSGSGLSIQNSRFYGSDFCVWVEPRNTSGFRVKNVSIINNRMSATVNCLILDSVDGCKVKDNVDLSTPSNGSYVTIRTNTSGGKYDIGGNSWHTVPPALFDANSSYRAEIDRGVTLKNSARTAFNNTGTALVINHGLVTTPDIIRCTAEGANVGAFWITNRTATQFTINWPTAQNGSWHWEAEVFR